MEHLAYDYPVLGAFWTVMWVFLWVLWLMVLFRVIVDILRDRETGGGQKAAWILFVLVLPLVGALVYLIARGRDMGRREEEETRRQRAAFDDYVRETAGGHGLDVDRLTKLSELRAHGDLSEEEYQRAKEKVLH
ncbi:SHOCT domain-containing protein [Streptomyces sp. B1866]|uniref:SHOCT domain-containing protein n=1 Tax=Streptomyces sp. B1866 TaxID=3075431 RepID=UPI00288EBE74|nr:SHOCT domain-containing protein [Streptomyces sp. B1866]MDT3395211.1 SHOCT domain-containing protein [Streptomyces sp. B1866]